MLVASVSNTTESNKLALCAAGTSAVEVMPSRSSILFGADQRERYWQRRDAQ